MLTIVISTSSMIQYCLVCDVMGLPNRMYCNKIILKITVPNVFNSVFFYKSTKKIIISKIKVDGTKLACRASTTKRDLREIKAQPIGS